MLSRLFCCFGHRIEEEQFVEEQKNKCGKAEQKYRHAASNKKANTLTPNLNNISRCGDLLSQVNWKNINLNFIRCDLNKNVCHYNLTF